MSRLPPARLEEIKTYIREKVWVAAKIVEELIEVLETERRNLDALNNEVKRVRIYIDTCHQERSIAGPPDEGCCDRVIRLLRTYKADLADEQRKRAELEKQVAQLTQWLEEMRGNE